MAPQALPFVPYHETADLPNVVVDGSANAATVLTLSHWPGQPSPEGCEADTSAEMVLRYLDHGAHHHEPARAVTNNHYDQDGLVGIYAFVDPIDALTRRDLLVDLATAGDFGTFRHRDAARLSMALSVLAEPERSPLDGLPSDGPARVGALYASALELLPRWLADPEAARALWEEEDAELQRGLDALATGAVRIEEHPGVDLAVIGVAAGATSGGHRFVGRRFDGVHPMALHNATERSGILMLDPDGGRHRLTCRYEGWVQFRSRPIRARRDLAPLAEALSSLEPHGVTWMASPPGDLVPELHPRPDGPGSTIEAGRIIQLVVDHLATAPSAWDPTTG